MTATVAAASNVYMHIGSFYEDPTVRQMHAITLNVPIAGGKRLTKLRP